MEESPPRSDSQHPAKEEPRGEDQSADRAEPQTSGPVEAPPESTDQSETPMELQEKGDAAAQLQAKPLWKPIPPLMPEANGSGTAKTRDQICQTEEWLQHTGSGHNTGG